MRHPLFSIKQKDLDWILQNSKFFLKKLKVNRIGVPIEETSGINNFEQFKKNLPILANHEYLMSFRYKTPLFRNFPDVSLTHFRNNLR